MTLTSDNDLCSSHQKNIELEQETRLDLERQLDEAASSDDRERLEENIRESGASTSLIQFLSGCLMASL